MCYFSDGGSPNCPNGPRCDSPITSIGAEVSTVELQCEGHEGQKTKGLEVEKGSTAFCSSRLYPDPLLRAHGNGVYTFSYLGAFLCHFYYTAIMVAVTSSSGSKR